MICCGRRQILDKKPTYLTYHNNQSFWVGLGLSRIKEAINGLGCRIPRPPADTGKALDCVATEGNMIANNIAGATFCD